MSMKLLYNLNGEKTGAFHKWLDSFKGEPRIAWYPSAGEDFRDLLYLNPKFSEKNPASQPEPLPPDIFLHTDYFPHSSSTFLDNRIILSENRTTISVKSIEELARCDLPLDSQIVDLKGSVATGRVVFLEVEVQSNVLRSFSCPVIYAFAENAAFCAEKILPQQSRLSHVIHVRYGGGCGGGGKSTGIWLLNILAKVKCEVFISDRKFDRQSGDERVYELYPVLAGKEDRSLLRQIRIVKGEAWSDYGDVTWNVF